MPKVGEAWYELDARDTALMRKLGLAGGRVKAEGNAAEAAFGGSIAKGVNTAETAVTGGTKRMGGAFASMGGQTERLTGTVANLKMGLVQGLGIGGFMAVSTAIAGFIGKIGDSISLASDLNETISKSAATFTTQAAAILAWSKTASSSFGLTQQAALDFSASFGGLLINFGIVPEKASTMSMSLTELAADMASFSNTPIEEALAAIQSGLVGESEPLRRFQVNLSQVRIEAKAVEMGLWNGKGAIDANAKANATYALIMQDTSRQQGDFARTSTGLANSQRTAAAKQEEAWTRLGAAILPIANVVLPALTNAGSAVIDFLASMLTHGREIVPALTALGVVVGVFVVPPFVAWATATIAATWPLIAIAAAVGAAIVVLDKLGLLGPIIDAFWRGLEIAANVIGTAFNVVTTIVKAAVTGILTAVALVMDVVSQIPGPWQDAAKGVAASVHDMLDSVADWGVNSKSLAGKAADDIVESTATGLAGGAAAVASGAKTGIKDPIVDKAGEAKKEAVEITRSTPGEIGQALKAGRDAVTSGADDLKQAFKDHISPTKEIAQLEGDLTGKMMKRGLSSNDPIIRAAALQWQSDIQDRLITLQRNVGTRALATGQSYAEGLNNAKAAIAARAQQAADRVEAEMRLKAAYTWGQHAGRQWADGLASQAYYAARAAEEYANGARGALEFTEPKEGPLRGMKTWGQHAGELFADAIESRAGYLGDAVAGYLSRAQLDLRAAAGMGGASPMMPAQVAQSIGAPAPSISRSTSTSVQIGSVDVHMHFEQPPDTNDAAGIRALGRQIGAEVRLALIRTPELFPVRGG